MNDAFNRPPIVTMTVRLLKMIVNVYNAGLIPRSGEVDVNNGTVEMN